MMPLEARLCTLRGDALGVCRTEVVQLLPDECSVEQPPSLGEATSLQLKRDLYPGAIDPGASQLVGQLPHALAVLLAHVPSHLIRQTGRLKVPHVRCWARLRRNPSA